ncbi:MAG: hypothetical protein K0S18_113 [Anaerocolumna sp.]|jgi:hypothetical protein|nr:hypothetical protein [Anaerocolumna sp.]
MPMYNEFQKNRYLESSDFKFEESVKDVVKRLFEGAAKIELQENCDLSLFNRSQVINLLKGYNSKSKNYLRLIVNQFSYYYTWCLSEGLVDNTNIINQYDYNLTKPIIDDIVTLDIIRDKYFLVDYFLDNVYKNEKIDITDKYIFYALFSGICGIEFSDLINLRLDDINKKRKVVNLISGKILKVDDIFIELAEEADKSLVYCPDGIESVNRSKDPDRYKYDESCYILKPCGNRSLNRPITKMILGTRLRQLQKHLNNRFINGGSIYFNGMVNFIKNKFESEGITLRQAVFEKRNKLSYVYNDKLQEYINEFGSNMIDRAFRAKIVDIIELYE